MMLWPTAIQLTGYLHHFPGLYCELGEVVEQFNRLEWALRRCSAALLGAPPNYADVVLSELPFRGQLKVLNALFRLRFPDVDPKPVETLVKNATSNEERRNTALHSMWAYNVETGTPVRGKVRLKKRSGFDPDYERNPVPELRSLNKALKRDIGEALQLATRIEDHRLAESGRRTPGARR